MKRSARRDLIVEAAAVILGILFLLIGWKMTASGEQLMGQNINGTVSPAVKARLTERLGSNEIFSKYTGTVTELRTVSYAVITAGEEKGRQVLVTQVLDSTSMLMSEPFEPGDRVFIYKGENEYNEAQWFVSGPVRTNWLLGLGISFGVMLLVFGRWKGARTLISLALTCLAVFMVLIPAIIGGRNIYWSTVAVCIYIIIVTLAIVGGCTFKALSAALGCIGGVTVAGLITAVSSRMLRLTGLVDEQSMLLLFINEEHPIDLKAIIFAGILIGALGAVMDVAMSISSALEELIRNVPDLSFFSIVRSGFTIGRDIMGTMSNTLVLAYVGSGMHIMLLFLTYYEHPEDILNVEIIAVEVLQALAGSIGILFTIPASTFAAAVFRKLEHRFETAEQDVPAAGEVKK